MKKTTDEIRNLVENSKQSVIPVSKNALIAALKKSKSSASKLTKAQLKSLPPLYGQENEKDPMVYVRFFHALGPFFWLATEYDPQKQLFFGYVDLGDGGEKGYFRLDDLVSVGAEIDKSFRPKRLSLAK